MNHIQFLTRSYSQFEIREVGAERSSKFPHTMYVFLIQTLLKQGRNFEGLGGTFLHCIYAKPTQLSAHPHPHPHPPPSTHTPRLRSSSQKEPLLVDVFNNHFVTENCENKSKKAPESSACLQSNKQEPASRELNNEQATETTPSKDRKNSKQEEKDAREQDGHKITEQGGFKSATKAQKFGWRFASISSWTVPYQTNSLVVFDVMTTRYLLASQPGGTYVIVMSSDLKQKQEMSDEQARACPLT